jgi:hypothetical protein
MDLLSERKGNMESSDQLLGYCGLYCGNCLYYINTKKGVGTVQKDGNIAFCEGCNSPVNTPHCSHCSIKDCNRSKGLSYCLQCNDYPCSIITEFIEQKDYSYHKDVPEMMERLKEIGPDAWYKEMEERYLCRNCGNHFTYFDGKCLKCN